MSIEDKIFDETYEYKQQLLTELFKTDAIPPKFGTMYASQYGAIITGIDTLIAILDENFEHRDELLQRTMELKERFVKESEDAE